MTGSGVRIPLAAPAKSPGKLGPCGYFGRSPPCEFLATRTISRTLGYGQAPRARHRPSGPIAAGRAQRTQSRIRASPTATRSGACCEVALEMEPHDRLVARQGGHGGGADHRAARHAEGIPTWFWCERLSSQCSATPGPALARTCFAAHDRDLWGCEGTRGTGVRGTDVGPT
jgi:hypothetical protein